MIDYPANLPQPSTSLSADVETPTIRTDLQTGLVEQQGRYSTGLETYRATWVFSADELLIFENWVADTLAGGVLVFGLALPDDGAYSVQPVRFVGGTYQVSHKSALWFTVTATVEHLTNNPAPSNRTPALPQWLRLAVDPAVSQVLGVSHRNALLTVRPDEGSTTTLRIFPPTDPTQYIYFGIDNQGDGETLITSQDVDPLFPEAVPGFPGSLPAVNQSFGVDAARRTSRLEMESGHPRQYAASVATRKTYQVEWEFSLAQLKTFQDFFFITLKSGAIPFTLTLPVDGSFIPVPVRFVGGRYSETYVPVDRFKVAATVERVVDQTVTPPGWQPYPLFYGPNVNVTANRKVAAGDAGKFFIVNPDEGQTINLHIYANKIEFGLLVKGLGNVLITRGPFILDIGTLADSGAGEFLKPSFTLRDTIRDIGTLPGDIGSGEFLKTSFSLVSVIEDLGTLAGDSGSGAFLTTGMEILEVLVDAGTLTDTGAGSFGKPAITLQIP